MTQTTVTPATVTPRTRSRAKLWWGIGSLALVVILGATAAIAVPRWMHLQRVEAYTETVQHTDVALTKINAAEIEANRLTVLYALQFAEAQEFQELVNDLAGYTDHYFSPDNLEALAVSADHLDEYLSDERLSAAEQELAAEAREHIEREGLIWQTDFLNLDAVAVEQVVGTPEPILVTVLPDDDISREVLEEAQAELARVETQLAAAETALDVARTRSEELIATVAATLDPLTSSALGAPDQAEVVIDMYPSADEGVVSLLRASASLAADSVGASLFTVDEDYAHVPVVGDISEDRPSYAVTDAWRATLVATHLKSYSDGITAAWITDMGSLEEGLGFNPFLPFYF